MNSAYLRRYIMIFVRNDGFNVILEHLIEKEIVTFTNHNSRLSSRSKLSIHLLGRSFQTNLGLQVHM